MGFNAVKTSGEAGWVTYDVPKEEQLKVEKGWLVGMHYDDLNADGVVPHRSEEDEKLALNSGFGVLVDHEELSRIAQLGEPSQIPIMQALKQLQIELKGKWRTPAVAAKIEPAAAAAAAPNHVER